jgi:CubicO group peptidase (beta-lactamase class C family)
VTEPFTTTALMTLVAAGKVSLDARANDYLGPAKIRAGVGSLSARLPFSYINEQSLADEAERPDVLRLVLDQYTSRSRPTTNCPG